MATNSHKIIYSEIKERLKDQFSSIDSLDTKSGISLGLIGALIAGLINSTWFVTLSAFYLIPILILLVASTFFLLRAFLVKDYKKDPEPSALIDGYQDKNEDETIAQLIRNFTTCYDGNKKSIEDKKKYMNIGFILLFCTILFLCISVFFSNNRVLIESINTQEVIRNVNQ